MRRALLFAVLTALLAVGGVACGSGDDEDGEGQAAGAAGGQTIEISGTEFALEPATVEVEGPGTYTFVFTNDGGATHALEVDGHGVEEETEHIGAGESAELTVELTEPGEYELYCPVGNHRGQGMEGTLVVGGSAAGGGGATTGDTTTDDGEDEDDGGYNYR
jgi:plastocyanin